MLKMRSSILRIALFGTLLLGAVAVFGSVASPSQSAHAAPKPKAVRCQEVGDHLECNGTINVGDSVAVKESLGKDTCVYLVTVTDVLPVYNADGSLWFATITGEVILAKGKNDVCLELGVVKGELVIFQAYPAPAKGGGKK